MGNLTICRNPDCLISFDPAWRVVLEGEPAEMQTLCPRCGTPLDRNPSIRKAESEKQSESDYPE